ncbi:MAG: DUF6538 domain-containing protein [Paracoccaceae bacterium]
MVEDNFEISTCKPDASKGGIYRVFLTIPIELRNHYGKKQLKKSTGERDLRKARRKQHDITERWYQEFRALLGRDAYAKLIDALALSDTPYHYRIYEEEPDPLPFTSRPENATEANKAIEGIAQRIRRYQTAIEQHDLGWLVDSGIMLAEVKRGSGMNFDDILELQKRVTFDLQQKFSLVAPPIITAASVPLAPNKSSYPRSSEFVAAYYGHRKWEKISAKQKQSSRTRMARCLDIIADPPLDQILSQHSNQIAQTLEDAGKANATIKAYISALSGLFDYIRLNELNEDVVPNKPWLTSNPFTGLQMSDYGTAKRSYEALTEDQLHKLFAQRMEAKDRLCLELLITTGCRLDEIALLTWEQIKTDQTGIQYIDLASHALVKNDNSKRLIPIPDIITLPEPSTGRLFGYTVDSNGKASRAAGKALLRYIHPIRTGPDDNRKTVHSLRHNLVGFMDNLNPPIPENLKDWITGHSSEGSLNASERKRTYGSDPDLALKYDVLNRIKHPWL